MAVEKRRPAQWETELQATIAGLGFVEAGSYVREPDCFETVRDLIRFLKREGRRRDCRVRLYLGEARIVENDLVPIVTQHADDAPLFDAALRLLVNLTQPPDATLDDPRSLDSEAKAVQRKLNAQLQRCKAAFADAAFFGVLARKLKLLLETDSKSRDVADELVVERILLLIRNVLSIKSPTSGNSAADDASMHDQVVLALFESSVHEIFLFLANTESERHFHVTVLECIVLVLKEQKADAVAAARQGRAAEEKAADERRLGDVVRLEATRLGEQRRKLAIRHSNFAGSYQIGGRRAVGAENEQIAHRVVDAATLSQPWVDERKTRRRLPRNRRPVVAAPDADAHRSSLVVRRRLHEFCAHLLQLSFRRLMRSAKTQLSGDQQRNNSLLRTNLAESHYFWAVDFFVHFARVAGQPVKLLGEVMGMDSFHYAQTRTDHYLEMAKMEKEAALLWGWKAQVALGAYKQLLLTLQFMANSGEDLRATAAEIHSRLLYEPEYRDFCLELFRRYQPNFLSNVFLRDLVETAHTYLRMLAKASQGGGCLTVLKRRKVRKPRRPKPKAEERTGPPTPQTDVPLDDVWEALTAELSARLLDDEAPSTDDAVPFDAAMHVADSEHKCAPSLGGRDGRLQASRALPRSVGAARRPRRRRVRPVPRGQAVLARRRLRLRRVGARRGILAVAGALLRRIGRRGSQVLCGRRSVCQGAAGERCGRGGSVRQRRRSGRGSRSVSGALRGGRSALRFRRLRQALRSLRRRQVVWLAVVASFALPTVVRRFGYIHLLAEFASNTPHTNHCLLKMLHRVAFEFDLSAMLFQASLFRLLQRARRAAHADLTFFGQHLLRRFFRVAADNRTVFAETLFWKTGHEALEVQHGYGSQTDRHSSNQLWTEELDAELRTLSDEFDAFEEKPHGLDQLDYIEHHLSQRRNRKQILRQLRAIGIDTTALKARKPKPKEVQWPEELQAELTAKYAEYGQLLEKPPGTLLDYLSQKLSKSRPKRQIKQQLVAMGFDVGAKSKRKESSWDGELAAELRSLHDEFKQAAESDGQSAVDFIRGRLSKQRTRVQIANKLQEWGLEEQLPAAAAERERESASEASSDDEMLSGDETVAASATKPRTRVLLSDDDDSDARRGADEDEPMVNSEPPPKKRRRLLSDSESD